MKVAFVHAMPANETALAGRMRRTAGLLAERGHDVTVFCTRWWDGDHDEFERNGVSYRAVSDSQRWFATCLPGALADRRPEVVHAAGANPKAALAARLSGVPVLLDWCGEAAPPLLDRALSAADRVCVPSEHVRTKVREHGTDARIVPESIPIERIGRTEPAGSTGLVWAGELDEHANLGSLLLALAEFRNREWRTAVIGDGPERERYEGMVRDLRIDHRVEFLGALAETERIARMKGAHVFVHTADRCPFARNFLLALACGCVGIVAYRADSAAHELIAGFERGIGVTDDEELVGTIEEAGDLPHEEYDPRFERFGHGVVLERYLAQYRELGAVIE